MLNYFAKLAPDPQRSLTDHLVEITRDPEFPTAPRIIDHCGNLTLYAYCLLPNAYWVGVYGSSLPCL